jgi:hypothetical protein
VEEAHDGVGEPHVCQVLAEVDAQDVSFGDFTLKLKNNNLGCNVITINELDFLVRLFVIIMH